ncbi:MAG TPA: protein translocase subunit SecF [Nitrospinota bacterium]|nr:protein translocase subunit SecF [Nitrospinota bacterium]|tara:strand:- start:145454 stop:146386 length:933 start_codon:yes stop_codon:yes gene_type:complete
MRIVKPETNIDFIGKRYYAAGLSIVMIFAALGSLIIHGGPNYGIDFKGGSIIQLKFDHVAPIPELRKIINTLNIGNFSIQEFGTPEEILIRIQRAEENIDGDTYTQQVESRLREQYGKSFSVERVEMVGPKVGRDLREKAVLAMVYALLGILAYITIRFEFRFGLAAIISLAHDTLVTVGFFSILDKEFTLTVIAALLTVIGYSLNDTIVVFDRIRENTRLKRGIDIEKVFNISINQTLSRTILTSGTTLVVILCIFFFGGEVIHDFSFALLIGVLVGTYSSIFVASPIILSWDSTLRKARSKKILTKKP